MLHMNAFSASAASLLSKYSNNLLKKDCEIALSGQVLGSENKMENIVRTLITFLDSFEEKEYLVRGLYRISGSLVTQQSALNIIENAQGSQLKLYYIYELSSEDKAACVKTLLRKMPDTLFPHCQQAALLDLAGMAENNESEGREERIFKSLQILVYFIPETHKQCLQSLLTHLKAVAALSSENGMDEANLGLLFCHYIFPVSKDQTSIETAKNEISHFGRLFPILLRHCEDLFQLSFELLQTLDASLMKQLAEQNASSSSTYSPLLQTPVRSRQGSSRSKEDDPEIVIVQTSSQRMLTPTQSTTELEMAKLAASIASMSEGTTRDRLLKKMKEEQRRRMGIKKKSVLKRAFTPLH